MIDQRFYKWQYQVFIFYKKKLDKSIFILFICLVVTNLIKILSIIYFDTITYLASH